MVKKSAWRTRCTHTAVFKARVALSAIRENKTMAERCKQFEDCRFPAHQVKLALAVTGVDTGVGDG